MMSHACCVPEKAPVAPEDGDSGGQFVRIASGSTDGMQLIPGGKFLMGNESDYGFPADGEGPIHSVKLDPFYLDAACVTNEQFNAFVNTTGYRTEAEKFGWSFVFAGHLSGAQRTRYVAFTVSAAPWWCRVDGATWRHPEGPGTHIKKRWNHPVVQVSWRDAMAYARWVGKRLPTEAEWECAARGGRVQQRFPWGEELEPQGKHRMNVWQGRFPDENILGDGHFGPAPAKSYPANGYGLYQMTGNVWEWCWDWFDAGYYRVSPSDNPPGPSQGDRRVMRGGSYLCHHSYCNRYRTDARSSNTPDSATTNLGFRCARDVSVPTHQ
ncbi:MAG TPA: formylglycine-generating enzyme family protein [Opitutaceae bacterium]|nr:formylglycine-generating enzyme family protein [Opitutaceae bacterium]